jgi:hypothetical protein
VLTVPPIRLFCEANPVLAVEAMSTAPVTCILAKTIPTEDETTDTVPLMLVGGIAVPATVETIGSVPTTCVRLVIDPDVAVTAEMTPPM